MNRIRRMYGQCSVGVRFSLMVAGTIATMVGLAYSAAAFDYQAPLPMDFFATVNVGDKVSAHWIDDYPVYLKVANSQIEMYKAGDYCHANLGGELAVIALQKSKVLLEYKSWLSRSSGECPTGTRVLLPSWEIALAQRAELNSEAESKKQGQANRALALEAQQMLARQTP